MLLASMNKRRETRFFFFRNMNTFLLSAQKKWEILLQLSVKWKNEKSKPKYKCKLQDMHRAYPVLNINIHVTWPKGGLS